MLFNIIKKKNNKLHVSATNTLVEKKSKNVWRASLFSSTDGSITLEAAIVLPIFFLFMASILYIMNILDLENTLYAAMEEASRSINSYAYVTEAVTNLTASDKNENVSFLGDIFNIISLKKELFKQDIIEIADNSYIKNGHNGISVALSSVDEASGTIDFNLSYQLEIPFFPDNLLNITIIQRCYFRPFLGKDISEQTGSFTQYVYITTLGTVYHTSPYCSYLSKYYHTATKLAFDNDLAMREVYSPCPICTRNLSDYDYYFYCPDSFTYHASVDCFYLNANILKVTLDSVKDSMHLCSRCAEGIQ